MTAMVGVIALAITACSSESDRRRTEPIICPVESGMTENPNWDITYSGRFTQVSEDGVYVVDMLSVKSSDAVSYYLDLVSVSDFNSKYGNSVEKYVEANYKNYLSQYVMTGDSENIFDMLDMGNEEWVAIVYAITADGVLGSYYRTLNFTTEEIEVTKSDDWKISVNPRVTASDGAVIDEIVVETDSDISYYVDVLYSGYIDSYYDGDVVAYFDDVLNYIDQYELEDGENFSGYLEQGNSTTQFNRLDSGDWVAYAIGVDYNGNFTGTYSEYEFTLEQDEPTAEYTAWLGDWTITDGKISYDLNIQAYENNYKFWVTGWEYDDEYVSGNEYGFITEYDKSTDVMTFFSQYLDSYQYNNLYYDVLFMGEINYNGNLYIITDGDLDLAYAKKDGDSASVTAASVDVSFDNSSSISTTFYDMRFADYESTNDTWYIYTEEDLPAFPLTMTKSSSNSGSEGVDSNRAMRLHKAVKVAKPTTKASTSSSTRRTVGESGRKSASIATKSADLKMRVAPKASESNVHMAVKPQQRRVSR